MPSRPVLGALPASLRVGTVLALLEALALVGYGVAEVVSLSSERLTMGVTTAVFLAAYGLFLGFCALRLRRLESWARSPTVLAQLIQLGVAWGFWGGTTVWVAVVLALVAVATLVGVLHPASTAALAAGDEPWGKGR